MTSDVKVMDSKKTQKSTAKPAETAADGNKISNFISETKDEFNKITWTSREELRTYTKIVIGTTFIFGMSIFFVDLLIQSALNTLGYLFRLIGG